LTVDPPVAGAIDTAEITHVALLAFVYATAVDAGVATVLYSDGLPFGEGPAVYPEPKLIEAAKLIVNPSSSAFAATVVTLIE